MSFCNTKKFEMYLMVLLTFMDFVSIPLIGMGNKATKNDEKVYFMVIRNKQFFFTILAMID